MSCEHDWVETIEGTTIHGDHLHVYECLLCDLKDYKIERDLKPSKTNEGIK